MANSEEVSYIDYETFLAPSFSPAAFANSLVTSTNDESDTAVDLSTPLSKVLFDVQEIDTHIHDLTAKSALPLLTHTRSQSSAAKRILDEVSAQVATLTESYKRLEEDVIARHAAAEEVRLAASRLWVTVKIGRAVGRCLLLGRQLEAQMTEVGQPGPASLSSGLSAKASASRKEDHRAMVRASYTLLSLHALFAASGRDEEGEHLSRINAVNALRTQLVGPSEQRLRTRAQQIVREFSLSVLLSPQQGSSASSANASNTPAPSPQPAGTGPAAPPPSAVPSSFGSASTGLATSSSYAQTEETKSRTTSALLTLFILSPPPAPSSPFQPTLLLTALQTYLQTQLTASAASLARALAPLAKLPHALSEVADRCQNIVALEALLAAITPPPHPLLPEADDDRVPPHPMSTARINGATHQRVHSDQDAGAPQAPTKPSSQQPPDLLVPLLAALDTSSLASFFWRSLAGQLSPKVAQIMSRGGVGARALRGARDRLRDSVREAVLRGCEGAKGGGRPGSWEREVGVMVGGILREIR